ncbi:MAG: hypothetical protein Q9162_005648 [Coniocarpon cinnabarinum]
MGALTERLLDPALRESFLRIGLPILSVFFVIYYALTSVTAYRKLANFKGPWLASFSELWLLGAAGTGKMHLRLYEQCKKHPDEDLIRVGPNSKYKRQEILSCQWYSPLKVDPFMNNIFSERDPEKHDLLRKQMIRAFALKENPQLETKIDKSIGGLVDLIERKYLSDNANFNPCDFAQKAQFFSMDVITDIALGESFGDCANDQDMHDYITTVGSQLPLVTRCTSNSALLSFIDSAPAKMLFMPSEKDKTGQGAIVSLVESRVASGKPEATDMLGHFLRDGMNPRQAISEICTQLLAGSDTTSTSVRAIWLHIISSPRVFSALRTEIDTAIRSGAVSSPITDDQSKRLPYLQACIKEGFRIWPPFTGLLVKLVNPGGENIDGTFIPGGTQIGHCTWGLMRHRVFGNDADFFRPERWLEAENEPERLKEMEGIVDLIFGSGRWLCLGKTLVLIELRKVFVELIRRFECSLIYQAEPWTSGNYTLFLQKNMWCRFERRKDAL